MTREDVMVELQHDENEGNGEILSMNDTGVMYHDYESDIDTMYQFEEALTDDYVASRIKIGKFAKESGLTEKFMINMLKDAYKDDYVDAICTLSGIIIPSDEEEYWTMFESVIRTSDNIKEWYSYEEEVDSGLIGKMYTAHQVVFVNPVAIRKASEELVKEYSGVEEDIKDEDMMVAALVATIDYHNETKEDVRVV